MANSIKRIKDKLNSFIQKYYLNRVIRGSIVALLSVLLLIISFSVLEYFSRFSSSSRTWIFFILIGSIVLIVGINIILPLAKYFKIGKILTHKEAAKIIGEHFKSIDDKLLNVLELNEQLSENQTAILLEGINQKIEGLKTFNFKTVINFKENIKYAKYLLIPIGIFLLFWISGNKKILTDSTERIVKYTEEFKPEAPFKFILNEDSLKAYSSSNYSLIVEVKGEGLPSEIELGVSEHWIPLQEIGENKFQYRFTNIQKDISFTLKGDGFVSKEYKLNVIPYPKIKNFEIEVYSPKHTNLPVQKLKNQGDLQIAEGSVVKWSVFTENTEIANLALPDSTYKQSSVDKSVRFKHSFYKDADYQLFVSNKNVPKSNNSTYRIQVQKDLYPKITVQETKKENKQTLFKGKIQDDYGFNKLLFIIELKDSVIKKTIQIKKNWTSQDFVFYFNMEALELKSGEQINYYFKVYDNDVLHGYKSSKSVIFKDKIDTVEELENKTEETNTDIEEELEKRLKESRDLKETFKNLKKKFLQKKKLSWEDKKTLKDLLDKQKELQKSIENLQDKNKENLKNQEKYNTENQDLIDKQKQIQDLLDEILDEENKKMFEELEKLMEKMDKNQIQKKLEDLKMNNENIEKELDRSLEMLKQFKFEQKLEKNIDKLKELQEEQEKLAEETKEGKDNEKSLEKQNKLKEEFDKLKEEMKEMEDLNKELENPNDMPSPKEKQDAIDKEMENSKNELQKQNKQKASESQKESAKKMEELAEQMMQMQSQMQEEKQAEDMDALKQILENLMDLSFEEEDLIKTMNNVHSNNPLYIEIIKKQSDIRFKSDLIADSLYALSKRQITIEKTVRKEVQKLQHNLNKSLENLSERRTKKAYSDGQYAMTSANNLALLLSQILDQMQKQSAASSKMKGSGECDKPGKSGNSNKPSMKGMQKMQQDMQGQLKSLQEGLLNQNKKGKGENGFGQGGMSKQLVQTAAKQEAIRRKLESIEKSMQDGKGENPGGNSLKNAIKKMKEIERDIVNKNITPETFKRQQEILQKMLEAEKAEKEQEKDKKRKSKEAEQIKKQESAIWKKYLEEKKRQTEIFHQQPINYKQFYKNKVEDYLQK